jgi:hypothetical protein
MSHMGSAIQVVVLVMLIVLLYIYIYTNINVCCPTVLFNVCNGLIHRAGGRSIPGQRYGRSGRLGGSQGGAGHQRKGGAPFNAAGHLFWRSLRSPLLATRTSSASNSHESSEAIMADIDMRIYAAVCILGCKLLFSSGVILMFSSFRDLTVRPIRFHPSIHIHIYIYT